MWDIIYRNYVKSLTNRDLSERDLLLRDGIKMATEGAEVLDLIEKHLFQGHPLNQDKIVEEMGDILYYITHRASKLGLTLKDIADANTRKLQKRFPTGKFSTEDSISRRDQAEYGITSPNSEAIGRSITRQFLFGPESHLPTSQEEFVPDDSPRTKIISQETSSNLRDEEIQNEAELHFETTYIDLDPHPLGGLPKDGEDIDD